MPSNYEPCSSLALVIVKYKGTASREYDAIWSVDPSQYEKQLPYFFLQPNP